MPTKGYSTKEQIGMLTKEISLAQGLLRNKDVRISDLERTLAQRAEEIAALHDTINKTRAPVKENTELKEAVAELQMTLEELRIEKEEYRVQFVVANKRCRENFEQNIALRKALKEVL